MELVSAGFEQVLSPLFTLPGEQGRKTRFTASSRALVIGPANAKPQRPMELAA